MPSVLLVNTYDKIGGGAAIATYRLYKELSKQEVDVEYFVKYRTVHDKHIVCPPNPLRKFLLSQLDWFPNRLIPMKRDTFGASLAYVPTGYVRMINSLRSDIVHLNYIVGGFIAIESIPKISSPLVWTFHDMWPFSGREHIKISRESKQNESPDRLYQLVDIDKWVYDRKRKAFADIAYLTIVTPSEWLCRLVLASNLFSDREVITIRNGVDLGIFRPRDRSAIRQKLNIPSSRIVVLFGAYDITKNPIKGFDFVLEALERLSHLVSREDIFLLIYGNSEIIGSRISSFRVKGFGHVKEEELMADIYNAADLYILPSLMDNLPNTLVESLACGTPAVAFDVGGVGEIITHMKTGYLARPYDIGDLVAGIQFFLGLDDIEKKRFRENARNDAMNKFDITDTAEKYRELYFGMLERQRGRRENPV